nr:hypothetical protein [Methylogaea oryzae]
MTFTGEIWPKWRIWTLDADRTISSERVTLLSLLSGISVAAFEAATLQPIASRIWGGLRPRKPHGHGFWRSGRVTPSGTAACNIVRRVLLKTPSLTIGFNGGLHGIPVARNMVVCCWIVVVPAVRQWSPIGSWRKTGMSLYARRVRPAWAKAARFLNRRMRWLYSAWRMPFLSKGMGCFTGKRSLPPNGLGWRISSFPCVGAKIDTERKRCAVS